MAKMTVFALYRLSLRALWLALCALAAAPAVAQAGWNVDLDIFGGTAAVGNGAPSDAFGGAANQPGRWNRISGVDSGPFQLADTTGSLSGVFMSLDRHGGFGFDIGYNNPANSGDFRLLLNDAAYVGPTGAGGHYTYLFAGLAAGSYDVTTYAVLPQPGFAISVPVTIPEAEGAQTLIVTGPMPGNAFVPGVTNCTHRVNLAQAGDMHVDIIQPPNQLFSFAINGFQIAAVAEPNSFIVMCAGLSLVAVSRGRRVRSRLVRLTTERSGEEDEKHQINDCEHGLLSQHERNGAIL